MGGLRFSIAQILLVTAIVAMGCWCALLKNQLRKTEQAAAAAARDALYDLTALKVKMITQATTIDEEATIKASEMLEGNVRRTHNVNALRLHRMWKAAMAPEPDAAKLNAFLVDLWFWGDLVSEERQVAGHTLIVCRNQSSQWAIVVVGPMGVKAFKLLSGDGMGVRIVGGGDNVRVIQTDHWREEAVATYQITADAITCVEPTDAVEAFDGTD